jgi:3-methyl-2-oxobutanoate hydroxymethyltransferase
MKVIEATPEALVQRIAAEVALITIGIGASAAYSGPLLVMHDMLGAGVARRPRFVKNFLDGAGSIDPAVRANVADVQTGRFPGPAHTYTATGGG